ncbi:MAG TPA: hypothetical protein PKK60_01545 [archaeon]|nr:hypothetical protein [archaeon]
MNRYLVALVMLLTFCLVASAVSISVPDSIEIKDSHTVFFVDITNESNELLPVTINFYTTTRTDLVYPKTISPNSTITLKVIVENDSTPNYHEVESKLEVYVGKQFTQKNIVLKFFEKEKLVQLPQTPVTQQPIVTTDNNAINDTNQVDTNSIDSNTKVTIEIRPVGWFMMGAFLEETSNFSLIDWVIFWFLVIVAAILVIAFVARVVRRI